MTKYIVATRCEYKNMYYYKNGDLIENDGSLLDTNVNEIRNKYKEIHDIDLDKINIIGFIDKNNRYVTTIDIACKICNILPDYISYEISNDIAKYENTLVCRLENESPAVFCKPHLYKGLNKDCAITRYCGDYNIKDRTNVIPFGSVYIDTKFGFKYVYINPDIILDIMRTKEDTKRE